MCVLVGVKSKSDLMKSLHHFALQKKKLRESSIEMYRFLRRMGEGGGRIGGRICLTTHAQQQPSTLCNRRGAAAHITSHPLTLQL